MSTDEVEESSYGTDSTTQTESEGPLPAPVASPPPAPGSGGGSSTGYDDSEEWESSWEWEEEGELSSWETSEGASELAAPGVPPPPVKEQVPAQAPATPPPLPAARASTTSSDGVSQEEDFEDEEEWSEEEGEESEWSEATPRAPRAAPAPVPDPAPEEAPAAAAPPPPVEKKTPAPVPAPVTASVSATTEESEWESGEWESGEWSEEEESYESSTSSAVPPPTTAPEEPAPQPATKKEPTPPSSPKAKKEPTPPTSPGKTKKESTPPTSPGKTPAAAKQESASPPSSTTGDGDDSTSSAIQESEGEWESYWEEEEDFSEMEEEWTEEWTGEEEEEEEDGAQLSAKSSQTGDSAPSFSAPTKQPSASPKQKKASPKAKPEPAPPSKQPVATAAKQASPKGGGKKGGHVRSSSKGKSDVGADSAAARLADLVELTTVVLPNREFIDLLTDAVDHKRVRHLAEALVSIGHPFGLAYPTVRSFVDQEFDRKSKNTNTLFRGNALGVRTVGDFTRQSTREYVGFNLDPVVQDVMSKAGDEIVIDPERVDATQLAASRKRLQALGTLLVDRILSPDSAALLSRPMRAMCGHIAAQSKTRGLEEHGLMSVFLFLRIINPALVLPQDYGLVDEPPTGAFRTNLVLLSRLMQVLVSGKVEASHKARGLDYFAPWVKEQQVRVRDFVASLGNDPTFRDWSDVGTAHDLTPEDVQDGFDGIIEALYNLQSDILFTQEEAKRMAREQGTPGLPLYERSLQLLKRLLTGRDKPAPKKLVLSSPTAVPRELGPLHASIANLERFELAAPGRRLCCQGPVRAKKRRGWEDGNLFLCNDLLLYCKHAKPGAKKPFIFSRAFRLHQVALDKFTPTEPELADLNSGFAIASYGQKRSHDLHVICDSEDNKRIWIKVIKKWRDRLDRSRLEKMRTFQVREKIGEELHPIVLGVGEGSVVVLNPDSNKVLESYDLSQLVQWGRSGQNFMLEVSGRHANTATTFMFVTSEQAAIEAAIEDAIGERMATLGVSRSQALASGKGGKAGKLGASSRQRHRKAGPNLQGPVKPSYVTEQDKRAFLEAVDRAIARLAPAKDVRIIAGTDMSPNDVERLQVKAAKYRRENRLLRDFLFAQYLATKRSL